MTPEQKARQIIDQKLEQAGWVLQDLKQLNLSAAPGVAAREYPTDSGPADYVLFVNRQAVGVIEAKRDEAGENLTVTETQTERYARGYLKWRKDNKPLPFLIESTGQIIRFTDARDPAPRSREIFNFFRPEHLGEWFSEANSLRRRLRETMPPLPTRNLRECQITAVIGLEKSLAENRPRALIHMATGASKTFTAITSVYRLLKCGGAKRILFLVDTRNLGKQARQEFMAYTPPDDARKFTELYNVQRLSSSNIDPHAQVCISTIQRMYSILSGQPIDESAEDVSLNEVRQTPGQAKLVRYNPSVPIETFDFIVVDECHRSIYNLWKQVLDYYDAFLIGLAATPDKRTFGFSTRTSLPNTPTRKRLPTASTWATTYSRSKPRSPGKARKSAKEWVDHRDRQTRKKRWAETEDDILDINKDWLDLSDSAFVNAPQGSEGTRTHVQKNDLLSPTTNPLACCWNKVHTKGVWFYDLRTNKHFTLKTRQLQYDDLKDFVACCKPDNRHKRKGAERFKFYPYKDLIARDQASLDIFWLKDENLDNLDDLPPPDVLQQEIIEHLEAALAAFRDVAAGLPQSGAELSLTAMMEGRCGFQERSCDIVRRHESATSDFNQDCVGIGDGTAHGPSEKSLVH